MSWHDLSPRDRRAVALGAPILVAGLLWATVVSPYAHAARETAGAIEEERGLLRRERVLLAAEPLDRAAWAEGADRLLDASGRLFGGELEEARGGVVHYVQTAGREARVLLERVEPAEPTEAAPGILGLPVQLRGETDYQGLLTMLSLLESGPRLVRVDALRVQGPAGGLQLDGGYEALGFEMTAIGYTLADEPGGTHMAEVRP